MGREGVSKGRKEDGMGGRVIKVRGKGGEKWGGGGGGKKTSTLNLNKKVHLTLINNYIKL